MRIVASVIFAVTSLTDFLDGQIARKYGLVTDFGKFLDPVADKLMILGAFVALLTTVRNDDALKIESATLDDGTATGVDLTNSNNALQIVNVRTEVPTGAATIEAKKTLNNVAPTASSQFTFRLEDASGALINTTTNGYAGDSGRIVFPEISYKGDQLTQTDSQGRKTGVFTYKIREVAGSDTEKMIYDERTFTAEVTVTEVAAADGSAKLETSVAYKDADGNVLEGAPTFANFERDLKEVPLSKVSAVGQKELPGATLKLVLGDNRNNVAVEEWISGSKPHVVKVVPGTYTLVEVEAPAGYDLAPDITFTVNEDGTVTGPTVMEDPLHPYDVPFSKIDESTEKVLVGAKLEVRNSSGTVVDSWTSGEHDHTVSLTAGTYTLHETEAPDGYDIADPITFTVAMDGKITCDNKTVTKIVMADPGHTDGEDETDATTVTLKATKTLDGKKPSNGQFSFKVTGGLGSDTSYTKTVTNDSNGDVTFSDIPIEKAGTYNFTISEVAGSSSTINYDTSTFKATVTATETDGKISAKVAYANNATPAFKNTTKSGGTTQGTPSAGSSSSGGSSGSTGATGKASPTTGDMVMSMAPVFIIIAIVAIGVIVFALRRRKSFDDPGDGPGSDAVDGSGTDASVGPTSGASNASGSSAGNASGAGSAFDAGNGPDSGANSGPVTGSVSSIGNSPVAGTASVSGNGPAPGAADGPAPDAADAPAPGAADGPAPVASTGSVPDGDGEGQH